MKLPVILSGFLLILYSCSNHRSNHQERYPYSIADFKSSLHPCLNSIIYYGVITTYDSNAKYLEKNTSIEELKKLLLSEHPILRGYAYCTLIKKDTEIVNKILPISLNDDSAYILCDAGEWGIHRMMLADFYIDESKGKTKINRDSLRDTLLQKHNHLLFAYWLLKYESSTPLGEKHYQIIKEMAKRPGIGYEFSLCGDYNPEVINAAVFKLAEYKKEDDIPIIKEILKKNWRFDKRGSAFGLIQRFPDTAYQEIVFDYYKLISKSADEIKRQTMFHGGRFHLRDKFESFLGAVASLKTNESATILKDIIEKKLYPYADFSDDRIKYEIFELLKEHKCEVYESLFKKIQKDALEYEKKYIGKSSPYGIPEAVGTDTDYW